MRWRSCLPWPPSGTGACGPDIEDIHSDGGCGRASRSGAGQAPLVATLPPGFEAGGGCALALFVLPYPATIREAPLARSWLCPLTWKLLRVEAARGFLYPHHFSAWVAVGRSLLWSRGGIDMYSRQTLCAQRLGYLRGHIRQSSWRRSLPVAAWSSKLRAVVALLL